jgi:amidase
LAAKIRGGGISAIALTEYFIERIERFDKDINAVVVKTFESARSAARAVDQAAAPGAG